ncbi:MAG: RagB/SusD family nutrient uptake outer membrane protein [Bacteroidota bacterium]
MKLTRTSKLLGLVLVVPLLLSVQGCTDLDEEVFSAVTQDNFYNTDGEILSALAPIYSQLRDMLWNYHNMSEHTSDEIMVPTRGGDWGDGGSWRALHQHSWDAFHPNVEGAWNDAYTGVARANVVLANLGDSPNPALVAEIRMLRGFYYYQLMDFYGGVPIVTDPAVDPDNPPARNTRKEVFDFVESELLAAIPDLPATRPPAEYGRVTRGAAQAILANMYLNAQVFTAEPSASGLSGGTAMWQKTVDMANDIMNSGVYTLSENYFDNFAVDNQNSPENIFVVPLLNVDRDLALTFNMRQLHYNMHPNTPWNGFTTLAEHYNSFSDTDERKNMFLIGQQFADPNGSCVGNQCFSSGEALTDRQGLPLVFTEEIGDIENANEREGVRVLKWEMDPGMFDGGSENDYAFFRLGDVMLMKAEALNELNGPNQESIDLINTIRERVFDPAEPIALADFGSREALRDYILAERGREMMNEARRRQDLIRIGGFTAPWAFKEAGSEPFRVVFPVPQSQIDANPSLVQTPGY